jgi:translation initiation factor 1
MDLKDQLQKFFPDHQPLEDGNLQTTGIPNIYNQVSPLLCKYEKRNGRPTLIIEGFEGENKNHIKKISSKLKQRFSVGGSVKNQSIIIQGNIRNKVMNYFSEIGFSVKRVGG